MKGFGAMAKTVPLDEQIIATLTGLCKSDQAAAVLADAEDVLRDLTGQADKADVASLNPLATAAEARTHRQKANDARFEADRMEASVAALQSRLADLKDAEAEARRDAARLEAMNVRDALAAEIAKEYPRIVATMTDLVKRIGECDELCRQSGIRDSAEAIGRDCPPQLLCRRRPRHSAAGYQSSHADGRPQCLGIKFYRRRLAMAWAGSR